MYQILSRRQAKEYGKSIFTKWILKLTDKEIRCLKKYKFDSRRINKRTRSGDIDLEIEAISCAIKKSVIDRNIVVWRESHINFLESNNKNVDAICIGDVLVENGFMSTFLYRPAFTAKGRIRLKILVSKGTYGAYVNNISWYHKWEYEMLFDRNSVLEVKNIAYQKYSILLEVQMK